MSPLDDINVHIQNFNSPSSHQLDQIIDRVTHAMDHQEPCSISTLESQSLRDLLHEQPVPVPIPLPVPVPVTPIDEILKPPNVHPPPIVTRSQRNIRKPSRYVIDHVTTNAFNVLQSTLPITTKTVSTHPTCNLDLLPAHIQTIHDRFSATLPSEHTTYSSNTTLQPR